MACEVLLTETACDQRDRIVMFLVGEAALPQRAAAFLDGFDEVVERLAQHPEFYPMVRDEILARRGYRKASVDGYIVLHKYVEGKVYITNVFHERQDYAALV